MRRAFIVMSLALLSAAPRLVAGECDGKPGWILDLPSTAEIGSTVDVNLTGPATEMALFMLSLGQGPNHTSYGTICLDFPLILSVPLTLDATGHASLSGDLPCDPSLIGLTFYCQFITCKPNKGVSNQTATTVTDAICGVGDLCTFTPGGWGNTCNGGNGACRLDANFDSCFPNGISIGDPDGVDGDGVYALHFTSAAAIEAFLPNGGKSGALKADATNPTSNKDAGELAGQLLSAKLNLEFDRVGLLDDCKARDDLHVGDLVFLSGVHAKLVGWSVNDVIDLADAAVSGSLGSGPFDVDGDSIGDVTFGDLNAALTTLNQNFDNGTVNNGNLGLP